MMLSNARWKKQIKTKDSYHGYWAPKVASAALSSLIAVGTSSKFSAEIAHLACF